jgi:omega-6 fatty acid desaturase (delta-12 desaturase)
MTSPKGIRADDTTQLRVGEREALRRRDASARRAVHRYARPDLGRSLFALATSVVPFVGLWMLMYVSLRVSYLLVLALAIPAAGFLVRTYILFHDCAHDSLLPGRRANAWLGSVLGVMVFTPFARWRYEHAVHHATAGDLDRRFTGDVATHTVAEYEAWSWPTRLGYRLFRNPVVMFGVGPIYAMLLEPRWARLFAARRIARSVWATNLTLVLVIGGLCWLIGWRDFVLVEAPLVPLAGGVGIWLFYVQHQFDHTYWQRSPEWNFTDAALRGSSYLRLPKLLQFFSGSIGLHHVHHLNSKIPNYNLQRAHDEASIFHGVRSISLGDGLRATRLKLWDEEAARLVPWRDIRRARKRSRGPTGWLRASLPEDENRGRTG